eukprot:scaffold168864_cov29-Tisochrysis_lutea.AAC.2
MREKQTASATSHALIMSARLFASDSAARRLAKDCSRPKAATVRMAPRHSASTAVPASRTAAPPSLARPTNPRSTSCTETASAKSGMHPKRTSASCQ